MDHDNDKMMPMNTIEQNCVFTSSQLSWHLAGCNIFLNFVVQFVDNDNNIWTNDTMHNDNDTMVPITMSPWIEWKQ
jgi:hypothetical protein